MTVELERRIELLEKRSKRAIWTSILLGAFILFDFFLGMRGHELQYEDTRELRSRATEIEYKLRVLEPTVTNNEQQLEQHSEIINRTR